MGASFPEAKVELGRHATVTLHSSFARMQGSAAAGTRRAEPKVSGGYIGGALPVPIPNTEVKPSRADGTARSACGRVGRCRNSSQDAPPLTTSRGASLFAELVEAPDYKINAEARRRGDLFQTNPPRLRASAFVFDSSSTVPSCTAIGNRVNSIT